MWFFNMQYDNGFSALITLSALITATLKSWSLYIHGYTTRPPAELADQGHWPSSSMSSASPCVEPAELAPDSHVTLAGVHSLAHSLLISVCVVLWKAVVLTRS